MTELQSNVPGLPAAASPEAVKWAPVFDFDTDCCYPAPAVSRDGRMNGGLNPSGNITGGCRDLDQLRNANTYYRTASIQKLGVTYSVHMYALYFEKDQVSHGPVSAGHRHDWEYVLVWTTGDTLTHASFSAHGDAKTMAKDELHFDAGRPNSVKAVYHKDGGSTRAFRPAKRDEPPENELRQWYTPPIAAWGTMRGDTVSNAQLQTLFNTYNYGSANCPFNNKHFPNEIAKSPPLGYPGPDEWKQIAGQVGPALPPGLIARWYVRLHRDPGADNREVPLSPRQTAAIVVHLPEPLRNQLRFTLKHDKSGAEDRARTPQIGHGARVSGDAHDWRGFGRRIYLGDRDPASISRLGIPPTGGFYVDLVLVS